MANASRDGNRTVTVIGLSSDDDGVIVNAWVDPTTHRLLIDTNQIEYDEGDTDTSLTGVIMMTEGPSNTVTPLQVDASKNLQVDIAADSVGIGGGTQYTMGDDTYTEGTSVGNLMGAVRNDTLATLADTDNEIAPLQVDANGAVYVQPVGNVAEDAADSGNPIKVGGVYNSSAPSLDDGDRGDLQLDSSGNVQVNLATVIADIISGAENDSILTAAHRRADAFQATITSADASTATSVKAKTAAKKIYVTDLIVSVDTAMNVQFQDDDSPTVLVEQMYMPANSVFSKSFSTPLVLGTNVDLDVITSTSGNISVTALGYVI